MSEVRRPPAMGPILVIAAISFLWFVAGVVAGIGAVLFFR